MFEVAQKIIPVFSTDETAGGQKQLDVWSRGAWTVVNGHRAQLPRVRRRGIVGNIAPVTQKDIDHYASGKVRQGDIWIFTLKELKIANEKTEEVGDLVRHKGDWYRIDTTNDWHYARGFVYIGRRERAESGV